MYKKKFKAFSQGIKEKNRKMAPDNETYQFHKYSTVTLAKWVSAYRPKHFASILNIHFHQFITIIAKDSRDHLKAIKLLK